MQSKLDAHVQHFGPDVQTWLRTAKPRVVKWLEFPAEMLAEVHAWGGINVARVDVGLAGLDSTISQRIANYHTQYGALIDYYELWNEPACNGADLDRLNSATLDIFEMLDALAVKVKLLVGCFSEGNPASIGQDSEHPNDWPRFYPALRKAMETGGGLALHEYDAPTLTSSGDWRVLRYRHAWQSWPDDLKAIPIFITEFNLDGGVIGQKYKSWPDFPDSATEPLFLTQLQGRDAEFQKDNGQRDASGKTTRPNLMGVTLFDVGFYDPWSRFDVSTCLQIARYIGSTQLPSSAPETHPMDYAKAIADFSPNFGYPNTGDSGREGHLPIAIVCHIEAGSEAATDAWFDNPSSQVSAHYSVAKDGTVRQHVLEANAAWANGTDASKGIGAYKSDLAVAWIADAWQHGVNCNLLGIAIECEGLPGEVMPEAQYQALLALIVDICKRHGWTYTADRLVGHFQIDDVTRSNCPGPSFPWARLRADVAAALAPPPPPPPKPSPTASVLDDLATIWGFADASAIAQDPQESENAIRERVVAIKVALGING